MSTQDVISRFRPYVLGGIGGFLVSIVLSWPDGLVAVVLGFATGAASLAISVSWHARQPGSRNLAEVPVKSFASSIPFAFVICLIAGVITYGGNSIESGSISLGSLAAGAWSGCFMGIAVGVLLATRGGRTAR